MGRPPPRSVREYEAIVGPNGEGPAKPTEFRTSWLFPHDLVSTTVYRWGSEANWRVHPSASSITASRGQEPSRRQRRISFLVFV